MISKLLCLFMSFTTSACFASSNNENFVIDANIANAFDLIEANSIFCAKEISDNKIYLKEDSIYATASGIYLILNESGESVQIPELFSDSFGCFVKMGVDCIDRDVYKECPGCGKSYLLYCRNPDCPLKKRNKNK